MLVRALLLLPFVPIFQDPEAESLANACAIQGEYVAQVKLQPDDEETTAIGVQVVALGADRFGFVATGGGLPGSEGKVPERVVTLGRLEGSVIALERSRPDHLRVEDDRLIGEVDGEPFSLRRIVRKSKTLGAEPPEGAVHLFDGSDVSRWTNGKVDEEGCLQPGARTRDEFGSFRLHLEFRVPCKPKDALGGQGRGNSGVYLFDRYEVQILDSFGLHYGHVDEKDWRATFQDEWKFEPGSDRSQWCGALYRFRAPSVNACYPPGVWQTYDIEFEAPRFEGDRKTRNARLTVRHNGITIHKDVELPKGTGAGGRLPEVPRGGITLQAHGNAVQFRNVWIVPK